MPVFLKLNLWKQRKQANYFWIGTTVKLHSANKLFCLRRNKNNLSAKRSSGLKHFVQNNTCLHFVFEKMMCLHFFWLYFILTWLVDNIACWTVNLNTSFHVIKVSCYQGFMLSWFHVIKVSWCHGFMVSRCQGFKVARFQGCMLSRFHVVKVAILLETNLSIIKNFYQFLRIYCW